MTAVYHGCCPHWLWGRPPGRTAHVTEIQCRERVRTLHHRPAMLKPAILGILLATGCMVGQDGNGLPGGPADDQPEPDPEPEPDVPTGSIQMTATTAPRNIA